MVRTLALIVASILANKRINLSGSCDAFFVTVSAEALLTITSAKLHN